MSAWATICITVAVFTMAGCERPSSLHVVVPSGYRGVFKVGESPGASAPPRKHDGTVVLNIPASGVLMIPDTRPLEHVRSLTAEFSSGETLASPMLPMTPPYGPQIVLRQMSADSHGWFYFFIGSEAEIAQLFQSNDYRLGGVTNSTP